jgi:formyltetrahydrofolate synthetase
MIINSSNDIVVTINDKILEENEYTIDKNGITFSKAPEANDKISIKKRIEDGKTDN